MTEEAPQEGSGSQGESEITELATLKQALEEEKERAESNLANWKRAQADFINYKRRSDREKEEISRFANSTLILNLLPIVDDLERALASIPPDVADDSWVDGIRLVGRKLQATLKTQGLSPIVALGEPFDPNLHEAVMQSKGKEGMVITEIQKGYKLHDRIIRPTKVVVGNGEEVTKEA